MSQVIITSKKKIGAPQARNFFGQKYPSTAPDGPNQFFKKMHVTIFGVSRVTFLTLCHGQLSMSRVKTCDICHGYRHGLFWGRNMSRVGGCVTGSFSVFVTGYKKNVTGKKKHCPPPQTKTGSVPPTPVNHQWIIGVGHSTLAPSLYEKKAFLLAKLSWLDRWLVKTPPMNLKKSSYRKKKV